MKHSHQTYCNTFYPEALTLSYDGSTVVSNSAAYQDAGMMDERLFHLKTLEIIDELMQIMAFIEELEKLGVENTEILEQIREILSRLRSRDRNYKYTKIVHILTKYLSGIRNFSSMTHAKGVYFYKRLFESTLVAIIRELDYLD